MGLVSAIIGTVLALGAVGASQAGASQQRKKQKQATRQADLAAQASAKKIKGAEAEAADTARLAAISKRKSRVRTLLTGAGGVEDAPLATKTLLGQ